jgi:hypothetical protein
MKKEKRFVSQEKSKDKDETMDVYDDNELETMLENDEVTEAEYGFMQGRETKKKNLGLERGGHDDSISDELAKEEYEED